MVYYAEIPAVTSRLLNFDIWYTIIMKLFRLSSIVPLGLIYERSTMAGSLFKKKDEHK